MSRKSTIPIPEAIAQLQRRLDQYRSGQPRRTKLPERTVAGCGRTGPGSIAYIPSRIRWGRTLWAEETAWRNSHHPAQPNRGGGIR